MTATENALNYLELLEAALPAVEAEHKAPVDAADLERDPVRIAALKLGATREPEGTPAPDEVAAFARLVAAVGTAQETVRAMAGAYAEAAAGKAERLRQSTAYYRRETLRLEAAQRRALDFAVAKTPRRFRGEAAHIAAALAEHISAPDRMIGNVRPVPDDWDPAGFYPAAYEVVRGGKAVKRPMGANPILRYVGSYGYVLFFGALTTGDPRWFRRSFEHLKAINNAHNIAGGAGTTETDGLLGIVYGTTGAGEVGSGALTHTPLEAALQGGPAADARLAWEAVGEQFGVRHAELLTEVDRWRALLRRHHMVRWGRKRGRVTKSNPDGWPDASNPSVTGRDFAHSNLSEGAASLELAIIETEMYRKGMRAPVRVDLPRGITETIGLSVGTSDKLEAHPGFRHACDIFRQFLNPKRIHTFFGDDIRDPAMRALYGPTGCTVWDQTTTGPRFTANSGYNAISFPCLYMLDEGGVLAAVLGSQAKADAWLAALAGGVSVSMLPERLVTQGKTAFVMDDPLNTRESRQFLLDGKPVRPFGGDADGIATDDSPEWDSELYGLPAAHDPADRIAKKTAELRQHAIDKWGKDPAAMAGGLVSRLYNEIYRGRA